MPPREWKLRIEDILEAMARIEQYITDLDFEAFAADQKSVDAVVRNIEIIGEAARGVPPDVVARHPLVPWATLRGMRNRLIHGYADVDVGIVWRACRDNLPPLASPLRRLLQVER